VSHGPPLDLKYAAMRLPLIALLIVSCSDETTPPDDHLPEGPGQWETKAGAITPRSEAGVAVARGLMITVGGFHEAIEVYDPVTNMWRAAGLFPQRIDHVGLATMPGDEKVLVAGFFSAGLGERAETFSFDPNGDLLEPRAPLLRAVGAGAAVRIDAQRIAVVGGFSANITVGDVQIYDAATNTWTMGPPMPTPRHHLGVAVIGKKLYAIGGRSEQTFVMATVEVLDLETMTWSKGQDLQVARSGHAVAEAKGRIYAFGGEGAPYPSGVFPEVEEYDPANDTWRFVAPMVTPRHGIQAANIGDVIYVPLGGDVQGAGNLPTLEAFVVP
jgi:N-acetylneuraminic acid mutarotase